MNLFRITDAPQHFGWIALIYREGDNGVHVEIARSRIQNTKRDAELCLDQWREQAENDSAMQKCAFEVAEILIRKDQA